MIIKEHPAMLLNNTRQGQTCLMMSLKTNNAQIILQVFAGLKSVHEDLNFLEDEDAQGQNVFYYLSLENQNMLFVFFLKQLIFWKRQQEIDDFDFPFGSFEKGKVSFCMLKIL